MKTKILNAVFIIVFFAALVLPIIFFNPDQGKLSETENRYLATFPEIITEDGKINTGFKTGFENWCNDNIGFREEFVGLYSTIKLKLLGISTSEKVEIGKDGFYFYTLDNNMEIGKAEYLPSEEQLKKIADNQSALDSYYKSIGIEYVLMLTPSKASVYPEYIASGTGNYAVTDTFCDLVTDYLRKHTSVNVVNAKEGLLEDKTAENGLLYLKTDTHWNQKGSYSVYTQIVEKMNEMGVIDGAPIDVTWSETEQTGEFSAMLGYKGILEDETVPFANWNSEVYKDNSSERYSQIYEINKNAGQEKYPPVVLLNDNVEGKKLLIYGDSQISEYRKIPNYLSEHFSEVVNVRIRSRNSDLETYAKPDVILFSCSERYIDTLLTEKTTLAIPSDEAVISELPEQKMAKTETWVGNKGVYLHSEISNHTLVISLDSFTVNLSGWSIDYTNETAAGEIYIRVGENLLKSGNFNQSSPSVSEYFGNDNYTNSNFYVEIPTSYFESKPATIDFVLVSKDGTYRYEPIEYSVKYLEREIVLNNNTKLSEIEKNNQSISMWIDNYNSQKQENQSAVTLDAANKKFALTGWAWDTVNQKPFSELYISINDKYFKCEYGIRRESVASHYENYDLLATGFKLELPSSLVSNCDSICFIGISESGSYYMENTIDIVTD